MVPVISINSEPQSYGPQKVLDTFFYAGDGFLVNDHGPQSEEDLEEDLQYTFVIDCRKVLSQRDLVSPLMKSSRSMNWLSRSGNTVRVQESATFLPTRPRDFCFSTTHLYHS